MKIKKVVRLGVKIKVARCDACCDGHILLDMRGRLSERLIFMATFTPECWSRLKKSIATAEKIMVKAGWLNMPRSERGEILQLVKE